MKTSNFSFGMPRLNDAVALAKVRTVVTILAVIVPFLPAAWGQEGTPITIFTPGGAPASTGSSGTSSFVLKASNVSTTPVQDIGLGRFNQAGDFTSLGSWTAIGFNQTNEIGGTVAGTGYVTPIGFVRNDENPKPKGLLFNYIFFGSAGPTAPPPTQFGPTFWGTCPGELDATGAPRFTLVFPPGAPTLTMTPGPVQTNGSLTITVLNPFISAEPYEAHVNNDSGVTLFSQTAIVGSGNVGVFNFSGLPGDVVPYVNGAGIGTVFIGNDPHPIRVEPTRPTTPSHGQQLINRALSACIDALGG